MSTAWRPLLSTLGSVKRVPARYLPLAGMLVGVIGGAVYWVAAQFWPSSVAVVLSLFATALIGGIGSEDSIAKFQPAWLDVFVLLIKYNALMALTAANLPFSVPANLALGLIMICGQAASHGLLVSVLAARTEDLAARIGRRIGLRLGRRLRARGRAGHTGLGGARCRHRHASRTRRLLESPVQAPVAHSDARGTTAHRSMFLPRSAGDVEVRIGHTGSGFAALPVLR